jgi:hypothetical protein
MNDMESFFNDNSNLRLLDNYRTYRLKYNLPFTEITWKPYLIDYLEETDDILYELK